MRWKLICFDLDNTLFDHEAAFEKAIVNSYRFLVDDLQLVNAPSADEWFQRFKQNSDRYWMWFEDGAHTKVEYRRVRFRATMESFTLPYSDVLADAFHEHYDRVIHDFIEPYPGVYELFNFLTKKGVKIGVITNGMRELQEKKAEKLQLDQWMANGQIWTSEQYGTPKPSRKMFDLARESMQSSQQVSLFVGDSWNHDIVGAIRAGWDAIFFNTRNEEPATSDHATAVCHSFKEVSNTIMHRLT